MRAYEAIMADIVRDTHDDALRLEFASSVEPQYPAWSAYVRAEIEAGAWRRSVHSLGVLAGNRWRLIEDEHLAWEGQLRKYLRCPHIVYDRGLPSEITIDAGMFVEYGAHILKIFPIRHVRFERDEEGFDFCELFRCPHLASLESMSLDDLTRKEREAMAASPFLGNCAALTLGGVDRKAKENDRDYYDLLASSAWLRNLITFERFPVARDSFPGESYDIVEEGRLDRWDRDVRAWTPVKEQGRELEARHGYIPWLHPRENRAHPFDAAYHRMRGTLPVIAAGTPVPYER